jgi:hypothetical protein
MPTLKKVAKFFVVFIFTLVCLEVILMVLITIFPKSPLGNLVENYFSPYPYIDTKVTKNFSWGKYNKITIGMSMNEVRTILGEPFVVWDWIPTESVPNLKSGTISTSSDSGFMGYNGSVEKCWEYSKDGRFKLWDFAWISINVCFDAENKVKNKNEFINYN